VTTYAEHALGESGTCFYGKYRGTVTANVDPEGRGRVQVSCPPILVDGRDSWALPSSPYAGDKVGLFTVPPVGANVWVEFEGGHPDHPILAGCYWGAGEAPLSTGQVQASTKVLKTDCLTLTIDDTPGSGGVTLQVDTATGALTITLKADGITLTNGTATVQLDQASVSINNGALEVE
jgi:uncharacterized protein involved in type VI secretion and phage assembly